MGTKHTPTPWHVFICDDGKEWSGWPLAIYGPEPDDGEDAVCVVRPGGFYPYAWDEGVSRLEAVATAEFIVRACNAHDDLVAALEAATAAMAMQKALECGRGVPDADAWDGLIAPARAALAKARGE